MTKHDRLVRWIESHDGVAVERVADGYLWVRSGFTVREPDVKVWAGEQTDRIDPTPAAARKWLGY